MSTVAGFRGQSSPKSLGFESRGTFRDLSLWKEKRSVVAEQRDSARVWVIEYDHVEELERERSRASTMGLELLFHEGRSLVFQGDVPKTLGYDACGSEVNKTVLSVADFEVGPIPMPVADATKYLAAAKQVDPRNAALQKKVSRSRLQGTIQKLQDFQTRLSFSGDDGLDPAADWAAAELEGLGYSVSRHDFQPGSFFQKRMTPQIIAELRGVENPERVVVLGAHLDSTAGWFSEYTKIAPGADDNGSGSAVLLEIARIISESGVKFKNTLRLVLFTGEEQGLVGSRKLAEKYKKEKVDVIGMLNVDMIGYRPPGTPLTVVLMDRNSDEAFMKIVMTAAKTYLGDRVEIGYTQACCSDQQSFWELGFPSACVFETPTRSVAYPYYHTGDDLLEHLDMEQIEAQGISIMASTLLFAEISD